MLKSRYLLKNKANSVKSFAEEKLIKKRSKGGLNTIEILLIIAVLLIVTYPLYRNMITSLFTTVQAWFTKVTSEIFK